MLHIPVATLPTQQESWGGGGGDPISLYTAFLDAETEAAGKFVACEQTPRYLFYADEIMAVLPNARIINLVHDPRDVLLAQKNKWRLRFQGARNISRREAFRSWANYHPAIIARLWVGAVREAQRHENHDRFRTFRFEDLVRNPQGTIRDICDWLGEEYHEQMLYVPRIGSSTSGYRGTDRGFSSAYAGSWTRGGLSPHELTVCDLVAGAELDALGYERGARPNRLTLLSGLPILALKVALAVPLNLSRTTNLRDTLRRRLNCGKRA